MPDTFTAAEGIHAANAGALACPATIYDVKRGTVATGAVVSLASTVVTAVAPTGFFLQVKPGDPGYAGVDDSAVFVYQPSPTAKAGDRVSLTSATVAVSSRMVTSTPVPTLTQSGGLASRRRNAQASARSST